MPSTLATVNALAAQGGALAADGGVLARHGGDKGPFGFLFLLLIFGAIAGGVYLIRRRRRGDASAGPTPPPSPRPSGGDARALLDERFAKGEIDQAEYEHRRAVLTGGPVSEPTDPPPSDDE